MGITLVGDVASLGQKLGSGCQLSEVFVMTVATDTKTDIAASDYAYYDKYYKHACEVCVPIILKTPIYVAPIVIEKKPACVEKKY